VKIEITPPITIAEVEARIAGIEKIRAKWKSRDHRFARTLDVEMAALQLLAEVIRRGQAEVWMS
jgi:hypothetical protein